jgi:hypothetical protein
MAKRIKRINEELMFKVLDILLPGEYYIRNGYYSFLISPKGKPMQLDIYYPKLGLALEFNGKQHYRYSDYFFSNKKQFEYLKTCDKLKKDMCKKLGIKLIIIDYTKKITEDYIRMRLVKAGKRDILGDKKQQE